MAGRGKKAVVVWMFLADFLVLGPMKCTGVYFLPFQRELGADFKETSLVFSIMYGCYYFSGPIATLSCTILGYRKTSLLGSLLCGAGVCLSCLANSVGILYVTLGVFLGVGACCVLTPMHALLGQLYTTKRPLVNNVVTLGGTIASIPLSLVAQLWIDWYGWRGSLLLVGGITLNAVPVVMAAMSVAAKCDAEEFAAKRRTFDTSLLKSGGFMLFCLACGLHSASATVVKTYLIRYAQSRGVGDLQAAGLAAIKSAVIIALKPIVGYLSSCTHIGPLKVRRSYLLAASILLQSLTTAALPFLSEAVALAAVVVAYAMCAGAVGALPMTVLSDLFGSERLITSLAIRSVAVGTLSMAGPPLVGLAIDVTGSYDAAFFSCTAMAAASSALFFFTEVCRRAPKSEETAPAGDLVDVVASGNLE